MLTTDPIYWKPYRTRIRIQNLSKVTTYYTYDSLTDTVTAANGSGVKPCYCRVQLGTDHTGSFEIQFEDSALTLDTVNIENGNRCYIDLSKDSTISYRTLISGLIRKVGYERGIGGKVLYTISGSSTAIRFNERVMYAILQARKLAQDSTTLDITDPNFKADILLQNILTASQILSTGKSGAPEHAYTYPLLTDTSLGIINATNLATNSDVEAFIASVSVEYGEIQDAINIIEDSTDAEVFVDTSDVVYLRHQFQPFVSGNGFILTDTVGTADNADYTGYISANSPPNYTESKYKSDGFSNQVYGILPSESPPSVMADLGFKQNVVAQLYATTALESAQKFRPTHNYFTAGDLYIVGAEHGTTGGSSWSPMFRICTDTGGVPTNAGGVVCNILFSSDPFPDIVVNTIGGDASGSNPQNNRLTNEFQLLNTASVPIPFVILDTTKDYWLICSNANVLANRLFIWAKDNTNNPTANGMYRHTSGFSSLTAGGSGWAFYQLGKPCFGIGRYRSQSFIATDPKSIAETGSGYTAGGIPRNTVISSTLGNIPSSTRSRLQMYKYMANQLYFMARPRVSWSTTVINPPNIPIFPNDPLMIVDNTLDFSTTGTQVVTATTGDMVYEFGSRGGEGNVFQSALNISIQPVGMANHY